MSSKNDSKQEFKQKLMIVSVEDYQAKDAELARLREEIEIRDSIIDEYRSKFGLLADTLKEQQ